MKLRKLSFLGLTAAFLFSACGGTVNKNNGDEIELNKYVKFLNYSGSGFIEETVEVRIKNLEQIGDKQSYLKFDDFCRVVVDTHVKPIGIFQDQVLVYYAANYSEAYYNHFMKRWNPYGVLCPKGALFFSNKRDILKMAKETRESESAAEKRKKVEASEKAAVEDILKTAREKGFLGKSG